MQFNTKLSDEWIKSVASKTLCDPDSTVLETELAGMVLFQTKKELKACKKEATA